MALRRRYNGAKHLTEAWAAHALGRGAFLLGRSKSGSTCGLIRSENAGISSENYVGIIMVENLRFLGEGSSAQGKPGAKARTEVVGDGQQVEIPAPLTLV